MFDRLYQENWLEQVTTKKGQSNWSIASLCSELVAKMAKYIGMTIRKGIVVPFLPCLVAFWGFHPYMFFHFFKCFFVTCHPRQNIIHLLKLIIYSEHITDFMPLERTHFAILINLRVYMRAFLLNLSRVQMTCSWCSCMT